MFATAGNGGGFHRVGYPAKSHLIIPVFASRLISPGPQLNLLRILPEFHVNRRQNYQWLS